MQSALAGRYSVERELGRGGTAVVYLARDERHDRHVAVKVLREDLAVSLAADRFLREIAIAARLTHPHILPLHDSGEVPGPAGLPPTIYYVMPWVEGETLADRLLREGPLPVADALRLARGVASALSFAHARGVVHRDIKPGNILLEDGEAVVADFGLARAIDAAVGDPVSLPGLVMGTPAYMSPEQGAGDLVDGRSDLYALGCVLFEMLTGQPPFIGGSAQALQARHRAETPPPVTIVRPLVDVRVQALLDRLLAKVPADRLPDAGTVVRTLDHLLATTHVITASSLPATRPRLRRPVVLALVVVGAVAAGGLALAAMGERDPPVPVAVLVADFQADAADSAMAGVLRELAITSLSQSPRLAPVPRGRVTAVMQDAGMPDSAVVAGARARELAFRLSAGAVVEGRVERAAAGQYALTLRAVQPSDGTIIVSEGGSATDATLVETMQRLSHRLRAELGDREADIRADKPLWEVATPSFEAFRKFTLAGDLSIGANLDASNRMLREAIAIDTGFAAAYAMLGINYITLRKHDSAAIALDEALRRPARLGDGQRYRLEGDMAYALRHDLSAAVRHYDLYLQEVPQSVGGRNNRGIFRSSLGLFEEALADFDEAVRLERSGVRWAQPQLVNGVLMRIALGRMADAHRVAAGTTGPFADFAALTLAAAEDRWPEAETLAVRVRGDPSTPSWVRMHATGVLASALAARGLPGAADAVLQEAPSTGAAEARWLDGARLLLADARGVPPPEVTARMAADSSGEGLLLRASWLAARGDTAAAMAARDAALAGGARDTALVGQGAAALQARLCRGRASCARAAARVATVARRGELDNMAPGRTGTLQLRLLAADAFARAGQPDSARAYRTLLHSPLALVANQLALRGLVLPSRAAADAVPP